MSDNTSAGQSSSGTATKAFIGGLTGTMGVIVALIIGLLLCCCCFVVLVSISYTNKSVSKINTSNSSSISNNDNNSSNSNSTNSAATAEVFKIGDSIKVGDLTLVVNDFADNVNSNNQFLKPADGKKYVAVDVKITYTGDSSEYAISSDFNLQDSDSYKYDATVFEIKAPELKAGEIKKGESVRGWVAFEIPKSSKNLQLIYAPGFFDSTQVKVNLTK